MSGCPRFGKWIGGCKFEARWDLGEPTRGSQSFSGSAAGIVMAMEASKKKTYVRDICVRCGKTIERSVETRETPNV